MSGLLNKLHLKKEEKATRSDRSSSTLNSVESGPVQQRTVVDAPIVQETVRNDRIVEVQPVLHREVDKNVVHHIEKHINEPRAPSMSGVVEKNPVVDQHVHTNVTNEIQPVIHRERVVPVAERVEEHLNQRIVEPTVHTHEVVYDNTPLPSGQASLNANEQHKHGLFHRH